VARFADSGVPRVMRKLDGQPDTSANVAADIRRASASGQPLPLGVRRFMEPRFKADFSQVKVHTDDRAASLSRQLNARAFAVGSNVFFGKGQFRPETGEGKELIAHELTHTIQQGAAVQRSEDVVQRSEDVVQRSEDVSVTHSAPVQVQRGIVSEALDFLADKVNAIPGFRMFTIVLGVNPVNMSRVDRSAANILRALVEFIPGGNLIVRALDNYGVFEKAGAWVDQQIRTLAITGSAVRAAVMEFVEGLGVTSLANPGAVWDRGKRIFTDFIDRIISFAKGLASGIIDLVKDAILRPIAALAAQSRGWDLLKAVLGRDPITGDPFPRNADTLIGGFMKLIGQEEVWQNLKKANGVARAWAWFQGALSGLMGFVQQIPTIFINALKSLTITDIIVLPVAFGKVAMAFGDFVGQFISWAGNAVWNLLEIIFDVVSPGAFGYVKRTGAALKSILKNPLPFVGNLVKAAKLGFTNFAARFGTHLKAGLIDWLTGSLPGVYIPKGFTLGELVKFVFSVLGISWANVRAKLVKVVGETAVKAMEVGFDIVVTLVTQGPAAAWDKIKEQLANLRDMVIGGITDLVVDAVVKKAVPKLISMFIPGAGFIGAIMSIYDTVMVFVAKISRIMAVVTGFINSIVAIAAGNIGGAAARVEGILAGMLSLAINFLAGFAGLGKVADKVMGVINKVRVHVDKAIDWLINWIVTMAKKLFAKVFGKKDKDKKDDNKDDEKSRAVKAKVGAALAGKSVENAEAEQALLASIYDRFKPEGLKGIRFQPSKQAGAVDVIVSASLAQKVASLNMKQPGALEELASIAGMMMPFSGRTTIYVTYAGKSFGRVSQKKGKFGHAEHWLKLKSPELMERIDKMVKASKKPLTGPVPIHLDINRTPCDGCATHHLQQIIMGAAIFYPHIPISISISAASVSTGAQITTTTGVKALMASGVELTPSKVWTEIKKQMKSSGIQQFDYGGKTYTIDDVADFEAEAKDVQRLIDKTVRELNKAKAKELAKGSGV
jgi:hypothetical protein